MTDETNEPPSLEESIWRSSLAMCLNAQQNTEDAIDALVGALRQAGSLRPLAARRLVEAASMLARRIREERTAGLHQTQIALRERGQALQELSALGDAQRESELDQRNEEIKRLLARAVPQGQA